MRTLDIKEAAAFLRCHPQELRCRAKTGTLHDVSALSGYCNVPGGHVLAFSFLSNRIDPYYVKSVEDQMVPMIASYSPPDD